MGKSNMSTLQEMLEEILNDLETTGIIKASAIISRNGLKMVSNTAEDMDSEAFAALSAILHISAESTIDKLCKEIPKFIFVQTDQHNLITYSGGPNALIIVFTDHEWNIELILDKIEKAADKVKELV